MVEKKPVEGVSMPERNRRWRKASTWTFGEVGIAAIAFTLFVTGKIYATIYDEEGVAVEQSDYSQAQRDLIIR
jgi:hypothetical protein